MFSLTEGELRERLTLRPPSLPDYTKLPSEQVVRAARNRESFSLFGWSPTLFNPKLRARLHRIHVPVQLLWGAHDRIVSVDYGQALGAMLRDSRFDIIQNAGHYTYLDQPAEFTQRCLAFVRAGGRLN
jgi:pimeloyl-ACP methyl ester carboxylesterase